MARRHCKTDRVEGWLLHGSEYSSILTFVQVILFDEQLKYLDSIFYKKGSLDVGIISSLVFAGLLSNARRDGSGDGRLPGDHRGGAEGRHACSCRLTISAIPRSLGCCCCYCYLYFGRPGPPLFSFSSLGLTYLP